MSHFAHTPKAFPKKPCHLHCDNFLSECTQLKNIYLDMYCGVLTFLKMVEKWLLRTQHSQYLFLHTFTVCLALARQ